MAVLPLCPAKMGTDHQVMPTTESSVLPLFDSSPPKKGPLHGQQHLCHPWPHRLVISAVLARGSRHRLVVNLLFSALLLAPLLCTVAQGSSGGEPYRASANLGENVVLRCVFDFPDGFRVPYVIQWEKQGVKIPIYIWYDGYKAHQGEGYEGRVSLTGQASLNLSNVRESDQGWYECKVLYLNRPPEPIRNGTWVHLDVLAPPQFRMKPPDVIYVKVGESITLPCDAVGTPTPQIVWYKDKRPLQSNANVHILSNELRISSIQLNDIGEYKCTSRNREGSISTTTKIIIAGPAVITLPPRNLTKLEGDRVEFVCEAKALPSNVTHRWFHNGVEISHLPFMENRVSIKHGTLLINPSIAEDSGRYTCEVSNGIQRPDGLPETAEAYLTIEYPARVVYSPTIQYLPLGLSGIVRCFIQASPPFQLVTWTKDRRPFDPNSTPGVSTLNNGSLLFSRVSHEHQGRYRCRAYNIHGANDPSQDMEVLVRDPPIFTTRPNDVYVRAVNEEVSMPCDGSGQPKPNIFWRKADGTKLSRDRSSLRSGNLTIKLLKKEDHGLYECVVENEIATIVASTRLIVNNTTPHTPTRVFVNASHFSATVHWEPNYNGGYEQSFHLNYRISDQGDAEWKTIRVPPPESTNMFTLYNLQADTQYDFQVFATNRLGAGLPTPSIRASTKMWSFGEKIYPTDASGATYIPTVQKPSGPKPDSPRNLTLEKMAQGWVLSWLAPVNRTVAVAYYRVEFRLVDKNWQHTDPIQHDTAFLFKNLEANSRYIFRVWAYSILGVGEVSEMIEVSLSGLSDSSQNTRAITFAVIGSVVFFLTTIVLSMCAVKICNKRKRKKIEKSYMMVTCPVNGTTSYGDSPVPSKHTCPLFVFDCIFTYCRFLCRRYSSYGDCFRDHDYHDGNYWQRPAFGRVVAGRAGAPVTGGLSTWPQDSLLSASADVHHDDAYYWRFRDAHHRNTTESVGPSGEPANERPVPPPRRRALKNLQYSMEAGLVAPLGARLTKSKDREPIVHNYDLTPSNQASARGSFRSDGSGQSQVRRPFSQLSFTGSNARSPSESEFGTKPHFARTTLHSSLPLRPQTLLPFHQRQLTTIYQPQSSKFQTSSPTGIGSNFPQSFGSFTREFSSIREASSLLGPERPSEPSSTVLQPPHLRELPSLRPIHERTRSHLDNVQNSAMAQPFYRATQDSSVLRATVPIGRSISQFAGRVLSRPPLLEPVPEAIYGSTAPVLAQAQSQSSFAGHRVSDAKFNPYQNLPIPRHLLLSPLETAGKSIRRPMPLHPTSARFASLRSKKDSNLTSSSDTSSEHFEYTRDKLLGAVEKVRSGYLLSREGHNTPVAYTPTTTPVPSRYRQSPIKSQFGEEQNATYRPIESHQHRDQSLRSSHLTGHSQTAPQLPAFAESSPRHPPSTSGHLRQLSSTITEPGLLHGSSRLHDPSSGSSGFISGTMSSLLFQQHQSSPSHFPSKAQHLRDTLISSARSPSFPSPPSEMGSVGLDIDFPVQSSMLTSRVRDPFVEPQDVRVDMSTDENYEFDSSLDPDIARLRREQLCWRHWQTWQRDRNLETQRAQIESCARDQLQPGRGPMSDTEIYGTIGHRAPQYHSYRSPRNMSIEAMEARCAQLRIEFLNFRRRQAELETQRRETRSQLSKDHAATHSCSSDEFESAC